MMTFVFGLELGFHRGAEGAEEHPGGRGHGSMERSTMVCVGTSDGPGDFTGRGS